MKKEEEKTEEYICSRWRHYCEDFSMKIIGGQVNAKR